MRAALAGSEAANLDSFLAPSPYSLSTPSESATFHVISGIGAVIVDHFRQPSPNPKILRARSWTPLEQAISKPDLQPHKPITYPLYLQIRSPQPTLPAYPIWIAIT